MNRGAFYYPRHFMLLAAASALILSAHEWRVLLDLRESFGVYGALHAATLVLALRHTSTWQRRVSFIAIGAGLSMLSVLWVSSAGRHAAIRFGDAWPLALLTLASAAGAASYGAVIRAFWVSHLARSSMVFLAINCAVTTLAVASGRSVLPPMSASTLAVVWWCAFSVTLWYHDVWVRREVGDVRNS